MTSSVVHVLGNLNLDIILGPVTNWPQHGTETIVPYQTVRVGGAAGNAIRSLCALGIPMHVHASVGNDEFGDMLASGLETCGSELKRVDLKTAYTVGISHPDGERTFFTYLGHLQHFDPYPVFDALAADPEGYLLVCGYFLLPEFRKGMAEELLEFAKKQRHTILFDCGWPVEGWSNDVRAELRRLLPFIDVVLPNELEATRWAGTADIQAALEYLRDCGSCGVVKLGEKGAGWLDAGRLAICPSRSIKVVDSVGAGDAFNAGYVAGLIHGLRQELAVSVAVEVACLAISSNPRHYPDWLTATSRLQLC